MRPRVGMAVMIGVLAATRAQALDDDADDGARSWRLVQRATVGGRSNPRGLSLDYRLMLRWPLFDSSRPLLRDNFVAIGIAPALTPALARIGIVVELQPLSILNLWAVAEGVRYFGTFRQMASFPSATSNYGEAALGRIVDEGATYSSIGSRYVFGGTLTLPLGPLVLRDQARLTRTTAQLRDGDRVFYEAFNDLLVTDGGWSAANDLDLSWKHDRGLLGL